jgi:hypothetical protein
MKNFRKNYLLGVLIALFTLFFAAGCDKEEANNPNLEGKHIIANNSSKSVDQGEQKVTIAVSNINDSRCPLNVQCVQAGSATANIKFTDNTPQEKSVDLCIGDCKTISSIQSVEINGTLYNVKLIEVNPRPGAKNSNSKTQKVTIDISKK